jgi:hypothetical protein
VRLKKYILFLFLLGNIVMAQTQSSISLDMHGGFIMVHRYNMRHLVKSHIWGGELSLCKTTFDDSFYNHLYNFPEKGISLYFSNLGNPTQLGNALALVPYMNLPVNKKRNLQIRAGVGIGYFNTTYNQTDNNLNNVISSNLTVCINAQLQKNWKISDRFELYNKIGMTHFSNAAFKMPNLGINLVTTSLGLRFADSTTPVFERKDKSNFEKNKKAYFELGLASGLKEVGGPGGLKYAIVNANFAFVYPFSFKSEFLLWSDFFHDRSLEIRLAGNNWKKATTADFIQTGIMGGYRLRYNKLSFMLAMGAYTYSRYKGLGRIYHRVGIRYQLTEKLSLNTTLKSHFAIADFAEWGIVYRIK